MLASNSNASENILKNEKESIFPPNPNVQKNWFFLKSLMYM